MSIFSNRLTQRQKLERHVLADFLRMRDQVRYPEIHETEVFVFLCETMSAFSWENRIGHCPAECKYSCIDHFT